jgi:outer membrane lipoprotein SlyB
MAILKTASRKALPKKDFAGPGRSFPIEDATHAREAISGATRSERAGNISASEEGAIKSRARAKLGGATDGLGRGKGGLAIHSSAKGAGMSGDKTMRHERY